MLGWKAPLLIYLVLPTLHPTVELSFDDIEETTTFVPFPRLANVHGDD